MAYNTLRVGNEEESAVCNLLFEYEKLEKNNDDSNCHIYYTFNDGTDKWCKYQLIPNERDFTELKNALIDKCYPIGCTYIQFPACPAPSTLFPKTNWIKLFADTGCFFRCEGSPAEAFTDDGGIPSIQMDSAPSLKGRIGNNTSYRGLNYTADGAFRVVNWSSKYYTDEGRPFQTMGWELDASLQLTNGRHVYGLREEVAPKNMTWRIWKRVS